MTLAFRSLSYNVGVTQTLPIRVFASNTYKLDKLTTVFTITKLY